MRPLALLVIACLLAGCTLGQAPEGDATPTPEPSPTPSPSPSPSPSPTTSPSPTPSPSPSPSPSPTVTPTPVAPPKVANKTFVVKLTGASLPGTGGGTSAPASQNCISFDASAEVKLLRGNVSASWTAVAPTTESLEVIFDPGAADAVRATGASPLALTLAAATIAAEEGAAHLLANFPQGAPALAAEQEVTLTIVYEYEGVEPSYTPISCAVS